jgi:hypothetical protein
VLACPKASGAKAHARLRMSILAKVHALPSVLTGARARRIPDGIMSLTMRARIPSIWPPGARTCRSPPLLQF